MLLHNGMNIIFYILFSQNEMWVILTDLQDGVLMEQNHIGMWGVFNCQTTEQLNNSVQECLKLQEKKKKD